MLRVDSNPSLIRESGSKAILNNDANALQAYKQKRARDQKQDRIIEQWDSVVSDVDNIKTMLCTILNKLEKIENK